MYQEESVSHESVGKHAPAKPAARPTACVEHSAQCDCCDYTDKLVPRVCHEVIDLRLRIDIEEVTAGPESEELKEDDDKGGREGSTKQLRLEFAVEPSDKG